MSASPDNISPVSWIIKLQRSGAVHFLRCQPTLIAMCLLLLLASGCGFDGGSFPPPTGRVVGSRMYGRVVSAENPQMSVANATVNVTATYTPARSVSRNLSHVSTRADSGDQTTLNLALITGPNGEFDFPLVPTGDTSGSVQVSITPASNSDRRAQQIAFTLNHDQPANLLIALPRNTLDLSQSKKLQMVPQRNTLPPQDSVALYAQLLDASNAPLPLQPTLLYQGNAGTLGAGAYFTASSLSTGVATDAGVVTAFWYNNLKVTATLTVSSTAVSQPPAPPGSLDTTDAEPDKKTPTSPGDIKTTPISRAGN